MPTVLIVDDDKHARTMLETVIKQAPRLKAHGLEVAMAGDGEEALKVFDAQKPAVIICDLLMPRMDGFRFCQALRDKDEGKAVGLIVTSGIYRDPALVTRVRDDFQAQFFSKPYQIKDLVDAIERCLVKSGSRSSVTIIDPPTRSGTFDAASVPDLLLDLFESNATGMLDLEKNRSQKSIELVAGNPSAITSNQRQETLGQFLIGKRAITEQQFRDALKRASDEGEKLGEALVEVGALSPTQLHWQLAAQMRARLADALRWKTGSFEFRKGGEILGAKRVPVEAPTLIFAALRESIAIDEAAQACAVVSCSRFEWTPRGTKLRGAFSAAFGEALASGIDAAKTLEQLLGTSDAISVLPAVEALLLCRFVEPRQVASSGTTRAVQAPAFEASPGSAAPSSSAQPASTSKTQPVDLYELLFGDENLFSEGPSARSEASRLTAQPARHEESGLIDVGTFLARRDPPEAPSNKHRERIVGELLRLEGKDWYQVLELERTADTKAIERAFADRSALFAQAKFPASELGADYEKVKELHAAYRQAHDTLVLPERRRAYDKQLDKYNAPPTKQAVDAELQFANGETFLAAGHLDDAITSFRTAVDLFPGEPDYRAELGWALAEKNRTRAPLRPGTRGQEAAAFAHVTQALAVDPEHPAALEYAGRILLLEGDLDGATTYLERSLDKLPVRLGALGAIEELFARKGDFARLERAYRKLVHRVANGEPALVFRLWMALGKVYQEHLGQIAAARTAYQCAARIHPQDPSAKQALAALTARNADPVPDRISALRACWRENHASAKPLFDLFHLATESGQSDLAFVVAAVLVARGQADDEVATCHRQSSPRLAVRTPKRLDEAAWARLAHPDDDPRIAGLLWRLEPLAELLAPVRLLDLGVSQNDFVSELPSPFHEVLRETCQFLGAPVPAVATWRNPETQLVGALSPTLLLPASLLQTTDALTLAFQLGRTLSYLRPGRLVACSRSARVLKGLFLSAVEYAVPSATVADSDGNIARGKAWIQRAPIELQRNIRDALTDITKNRASVNLSQWARGVAHTAERAGLLACGDPAAALAKKPDGSELSIELCDYAISGDHLQLRAALGVSAPAGSDEIDLQ